MYYEDLSGNFIDHILYDSTAQEIYSKLLLSCGDQPATPGEPTSSIVMNASNSSIDELINATQNKWFFRLLLPSI